MCLYSPATCLQINIFVLINHLEIPFPEKYVNAHIQFQNETFSVLSVILCNVSILLINMITPYPNSFWNIFDVTELNVWSFLTGGTSRV